MNKQFIALEFIRLNEKSSDVSVKMLCLYFNDVDPTRYLPWGTDNDWLHIAYFNAVEYNNLDQTIQHFCKYSVVCLKGGD
jgi:hypothetical protein